MEYTMNIKAGTLWVNVKPTGDSIPYGFDADKNAWIPCDGAYGVFDYLYQVKEHEEALEYFDNEVYRLVNDGVTYARIELPPRLGGFVFTISTQYEGNNTNL